MRKRIMCTLLIKPITPPFSLESVWSALIKTCWRCTSTRRSLIGGLCSTWLLHSLTSLRMWWRSPRSPQSTHTTRPTNPKNSASCWSIVLQSLVSLAIRSPPPFITALFGCRQRLIVPRIRVCDSKFVHVWLTRLSNTNCWSGSLWYRRRTDDSTIICFWKKNTRIKIFENCKIGSLFEYYESPRFPSSFDLIIISPKLELILEPHRNLRFVFTHCLSTNLILESNKWNEQNAI